MGTYALRPGRSGGRAHYSPVVTGGPQLLALCVGAAETLDAPAYRRAPGQDDSPRPPGDVDLGPGSAPAGPCAECGYAAASLAPDGLFVAVVSIPGEYRDLLTRFETRLDLDRALRTHPGDGEASALERMAYVSNSLHAWATRISWILEGIEDTLQPMNVEPRPAGANTAPIPAVLAALQAAATDLARTVAHSAATEWGRCAQLDGRSVSVRDLLVAALHDALHHLTAVESRLEAATVTRPG